MAYTKKEHGTLVEPGYGPVGRKELVDLTNILEKKSAVVLGEKGMGKTFLMNMYKNLYSTNYSKIVSVHCKKGGAPFSVFNQIAKELTP
ncbi:MAG: AAA family ATPase, partial [archaeon]